MRRLIVVGWVLSIMWSCGGKAVVDGSGGSSSTGTTTTSSSSGTTSTTSSGSTSTTSSGTTTTTSVPSDCVAACTDLFNCGLSSDSQGGQLCPGFDPSDLGLFLDGEQGDGCVSQCEQIPALIALIDPDDCGTTVTTISAANVNFGCVCQSGIGHPDCD